MFHRKMNKNTMSLEHFEQFRQIVLQDPALQERLRATTDHVSFVSLVVQAGDERDCPFTPGDVEAALRVNRKAWLQGRMVS